MKRKATASETNSSSGTRKRIRSEDVSSGDDISELPESATPSRSRRTRVTSDNISNADAEGDAGTMDAVSEEASRPGSVTEETPKKKRGRPKGSKNTPRKDTATPVKSKAGLFSTPVKTIGSQTPSKSRNVDRSARRKSARAIIEQVIGDGSDADEEEELAQDIYGSDDEEDELAGEGQDQITFEDTLDAPETPSKRGRAKGRPKSSKTRRSPTPPKDLAAHELYFSQNKSARAKTSNNTLSSLSLLTHEEYFTLIRSYKDHHEKDLIFLQELHARSFNQWAFELAEGFSICLYGFGSKRTLLTSFAKHIYNTPTFNPKANKIVIINGYLATSSIRDILTTISRAITPQPQKLGSQPAEMVESVLSLLSDSLDLSITLLINSIDSTALRRPLTQTLLSRLSSHPQIHLLASADHPNFPLLWDSSLRGTYNFVFHDCTTFAPYDAEIDVVDEVHALLGRSGRRIGGKEGVAFVLKSLPVKARTLFGVLVSEQLAGMDDSGGDPFSADNHAQDDDEEDDFAPRRLGVMGGRREPGVEYRTLYQKAVEDFICPNEMTFRTLLKEYVAFSSALSTKFVWMMLTFVIGFMIIR